MKPTNKKKEKKQTKTKKPKNSSKTEKVLIVAQEIQFAILLASNEKKIRDKVLRSFKRWLSHCFSKGYEFKEDDFARVWKGLFYAVWMSDKPLVQEELCETIAGLLDLFPTEQIQHALLMVNAGFKVLATEWYGIDHHRLDKFLMLTRRYLRGSLRCVRRCGWSTEVCRLYADMLGGSDGILSLKTPHYARNAGSLLLHVVDCFLEELAKVSEGKLPEASVVELLQPFCAYTCAGENQALCVASRRLLTALLRQSEEGLAYQEKTRAWERMGCPRGGPDALELVSDDEEEEEEEEEEIPTRADKPLDPRAGRVDVELATIPVPAAQIAARLQKLLATASSKAHSRVKICCTRFEQLARREYPLRVEDVLVPEGDEARQSRTARARRLLELDQQLVRSADELALRGLGRKHRKRLLARTRAGLSIVEDAHAVTNGHREEPTEPTSKKPTKAVHSSNKENGPKPSQKESRPADKTAPTKVKKHQRRMLNAFNVEDVSNDNTIPAPRDKSKKLREKCNQLEAAADAPSEPKKTKPVVLLFRCGSSKKSQPGIQTKLGESASQKKASYDTPKKVQFVLKNNSMQGPVDYYKSVRQSPSIPFDGSKRPAKANLKPSPASPINPFFKKKLRNKKK